MKNYYTLGPYSAIIDDILHENNPLTIIQKGNRMFLANNISELLNQKGWTLQEFASKVGKDVLETRKLLDGNLNITIDTLAEIALILETSVSNLVQVR